MSEGTCRVCGDQFGLIERGQTPNEADAGIDYRGTLLIHRVDGQDCAGSQQPPMSG